jgi:hypothetical protein
MPVCTQRIAEIILDLQDHLMVAGFGRQEIVVQSTGPSQVETKRKT